MDIITDGLLVAGALFAGTYCLVLAHRVRALKDLRSGVGGAIMGMTHALEDARRALEETKAASRDGNKELRELIARAEAASGQLRILLAATRDLPPGPAESRVRDAMPDLAEAPDDDGTAAGSAVSKPRPSPLPLGPARAVEDPGPTLPRSLGPAPQPISPRGSRHGAPAPENDLLLPADLAVAQG